MIGLAGKHLWGLDTNYLSGTWQTLQNYNLGTVQTTISGTTCIVSGTVVTGTTSFWGTESQVSTGDVMFLPNVSGTSSDIIYDAPYPITVISGTKIVISGCSLTLATASDYTIATTLAVGDTIDFLQYDLNLFMAKIGDYPLRYDNVGVKPVGCAVPSTACTAAEAASGNLDDSAVYYWKITYVYGDYGESNGSAASTIVTTTGASKKGALTAIPIGGQFVTARNIYRTEGGGSDYYYVGALADNTTTTYSDTSSDATIVAIGTSIPTTHDVPTKLGCIGEKFSRLYGGKNSIYPYRLFYTDATKPYAWDAANYVDRDGKGKIMKIVDAFEALVIFYERGIEMADVSNATPSNWVFITVPTSVGLAATQGFDITNNGIYFLGINNGMPEVHILHRGEQSVVNATFDNITPDSLSEKIDTFMSNINLNSIGISKLKVFDNKIYLSVAYGDSSILNRLAIYDIRRDAWSIHTTNYQSFEIYSNKLLAGSPNDNYCHEIETGYTDSSSNPVSFTWKSKQFNADRPDLDKQFQLIRIRGEADSGIINIAWSCDYNKTTGNFSYDLSEDGNEFIRYFPDSAMGRVIQLTVSCTNSVATKIIDIVMNFQIYELGS